MGFNVFGDGRVFPFTHVLAYIWDSLLDAAGDMVSAISHAFDYVWEIDLTVLRILSGIPYGMQTYLSIKIAGVCVGV